MTAKKPKLREYVAKEVSVRVMTDDFGLQKIAIKGGKNATVTGDMELLIEGLGLMSRVYQKYTEVKDDQILIDEIKEKLEDAFYKRSKFNLK